MKNLKTIFLLALVMALASSQALAGTPQSKWVGTAKIHLTEVYGYTTQEAENFTFSDDGKGELRFWQKDRPGWVYTLSYDPQSLQETAGSSPFYGGGFTRFPGENDIRYVLSKARDNKWFSTWDDQARQGFREAINTWGNIRLTLNLSAGLQAGDISAAQAVEAFFDSVLGPEALRTQAALEWRDEILKDNGLKPEAPYQMTAGRPFQIGLIPNFPATYTRFLDQPPVSLNAAFSHPFLAGWTCLGGALIQRQHLDPGLVNTGMAAFEREGQRLLLMLEGNEKRGWQALPVDGQPLRPGQDLQILHNEDGYSFDIVYAISADETEVFTVHPAKMQGEEGYFVCRLSRYRLENRQHRSFFEAKSTQGGWELTARKADGDNTWLTADGAAFAYMDAITDIASFPTTLKAWQTPPKPLVPEGTAMLAGVHLREKTSSRSRDLGLMNPGTLVKVLGTVKGDPFPWLHGQIGTKTGYMSTHYVAQPGEMGIASPSAVSPLPMARARQDLQLKAGTGLLDGKVMDLQQGTKMHVLSRDGHWLYVVVPRGDIAWLMDVDGHYGYVKAGDVDIRPTSIQLDWLE